MEISHGNYSSYYFKNVISARIFKPILLRSFDPFPIPQARVWAIRHRHPLTNILDLHYYHLAPQPTVHENKASKEISMRNTREECLAALRTAPHIIEPNQKYTVDDFQPGDAPGIARLYYEVYGEIFPIDSVYDPEELVRLNAGNEQHQVVGRTDKGDIIGLYAIFRNPPGRHIMEAGSWIVHPAYRRSSLAMRMAERIHLNPPEYLGLDVMFGQSVTDHRMTQKMARQISQFVLCPGA
jgi:hypothetical protein